MRDLDQFMEDLFRQIEADVDPAAQVVLEVDGDSDDRPIRVYEVVTLGETDDDPLVRGFLWVAVNTPVRTFPSRRLSNGKVIPSKIIGPYLAVSTASAEDAVARARQKLAG